MNPVLPRMLTPILLLRRQPRCQCPGLQTRRQPGAQEHVVRTSVVPQLLRFKNSSDSRRWKDMKMRIIIGIGIAILIIIIVVPIVKAVQNK
jgi:hypothetical protein